MRILITGSRDWKGVADIVNAIWEYAMNPNSDVIAGTVIVHGDCPTGADNIADHMANELGITVERHPANWALYGKSAGPLRNQEMVDLGADICLAFPLPESRGTWDCIRRARAAGIPVMISDAI